MTTNTITVAGNARPLTLSYVDSGDMIAPTLVNAWGSLTVGAYFRAINFVADNLASFPRSVARDGAKIGQDETPHPLTRLLRRQPNGYTNPFVFWRSLFYNVAHRGNGLARIERDPLTSRPVALHLLEWCDVRIGLFVPEGSTSIEKWYLHVPTGQPIPAADVIHLQAISHDGQQGVDTIALLNPTLQQAATLTSYQTRFWQKGTMPKGTITFPTEMTDAELDTIGAYIKQNFTGPNAEKDTLLIPKGGKYENVTLSPQVSQLAEQLVAATKSIAQYTGVPPEFLFERSDSKYTGVEQAGQDVVRYLFRPWTNQITAELTSKLLSEADQDAGLSVHLNMDALIQGDTAAQTATVTQTVAAGIRTENEGRDVLGLPRVTDPEADRLKRTGDTSPTPGKAVEPAPEK